MSDAHPLEMVDRFVQAKIPIVIIGGHAVNLHGFARATEDVDLIFLRSAESELLLTGVLEGLDAYYIGDDIDPASGVETTYPVSLDYIRRHHLLMLGSRLGFLDLFDFIPGLPHEQVEEVIATAVIFDRRPFASLHWLRRMKRASDRPQDRIDLANLPEPN